MKNVITTGHENNRLSTKSFLAWLRKIDADRDKKLFGIYKYIMRVERNDDVISIATFNDSIYTISYSEKTYKDLNDLVGYGVNFYPKEYEKYELETYFLWDWDKPLDAFSLGHFVINRVLDIKIVGRDGLILFDNGDALSIPFKDYEKPYYRASKRQHGDDTYREGYEIDFNGCIQKMRDKFIREYVVYSTRLVSIDVGSYLSGFNIYRESPYEEHAEKDKFLFRLEYGVIQKFGTWDTYSVPIYLEDGRIMSFGFFDYSKNIADDCGNNIIYQLKEHLKTELGKLYKFLVIYGGNKKNSNKHMDIVSLKRVDDGDLLSESNPHLSLDSDWLPRSPRSQIS